MQKDATVVEHVITGMIFKFFFLENFTDWQLELSIKEFIRNFAYCISLKLFET